MIEIAMLPSIVRETAVMIRSDIRLQRSEPRGSSSESTAPISRGRSIIRKRVRKIAVTRLSTRLKPVTMTPMRPPAAPAMPWAISFTFACAVSGAWLCSLTHEPTDELLVISSTIPGSAWTKSRKLSASGIRSSSPNSDRQRRETENENRRAGATAEAAVSLHQPHDGLEHERGEEGEEQRHHRFADRDERQRQRDDRRDEQHRAHGEVDAQRGASRFGAGSEPGMAACDTRETYSASRTAPGARRRIAS